MQNSTRQAIHTLLKTFAQNSLKDYDLDVLKRAYPFHRIFFDDLGLLAFKQERSVVTKMGMNLYPELARLVALENYADVAREKHVQGVLKETTVNKIHQIVQDLRAHRRIPNHAQEMDEILAVNDNAVESQDRPERVIADLYIGDFQGGPFFAEIKTPVPNLDICAQSKTKILTFETVLHNQGARGYLAFAYNPFVTRDKYAHNFTKRIMDLQVEVLMGEEFWDEIGGDGTFATLLTIIDEVGNEVRETAVKK